MTYMHCINQPTSTLHKPTHLHLNCSKFWPWSSFQRLCASHGWEPTTGLQPNFIHRQVVPVYFYQLCPLPYTVFLPPCCLTAGCIDRGQQGLALALFCSPFLLHFPLTFRYLHTTFASPPSKMSPLISERGCPQQSLRAQEYMSPSKPLSESR